MAGAGPASGRHAYRRRWSESRGGRRLLRLLRRGPLCRLASCDLGCQAGLRRALGRPLARRFLRLELRDRRVDRRQQPVLLRELRRALLLPRGSFPDGLLALQLQLVELPLRVPVLEGERLLPQCCI
jgi:hypothetical protein